MVTIDRLELSDDASTVWAVEGVQGFRGMAGRSASVDTVEGLNTPIEQSSARWPAAMQTFDQQQTQDQAQLQQQSAAAQTQGAPRQ